jgi:hypothetical protein
MRTAKIENRTEADKQDENLCYCIDHFISIARAHGGLFLMSIWVIGLFVTVISEATLLHTIF